MNKQTNQELFWYALRITYSRELVLKAFLDQNQIENFVPMRYELIIRGDQRIRKLVPAVHNLVFIHASRKTIDEIKEKYAVSLPLRYIMNRETRQPVIIPDTQMWNFIAVAGSYDEQIVYLPVVEYSALKGDHVRVVGGIFEGVEGQFVRAKGDRRVVVSIPGIAAVATAFIHPSLLEAIPGR